MLSFGTSVEDDGMTGDVTLIVASAIVVYNFVTNMIID